MAKNKTTETTTSVTDFVNALKGEARRKDAFRLIELITTITKLEAKMWGGSIIGFGSYHYKYESGHEGNAPLVGFSPRATALTLYLSAFDSRETFLEKLGKHKASKGCVYIAKLDDVDLTVLEKLIKNQMKEVKTNYEL
ncbi:DUF1801 domain-containing protein [Cytophaga aurantiaca]|uniref:DUF1801 domain-containing protein n=1 Tax=Cytophaga aurantiaca TaxID=29530 RepID=UPI00036AA52A|nr:DUF1801 domain-containing protein [Cytophaga aurantiaca]